MKNFKYEEIGTFNSKIAADALLKLTLKIKNEDRNENKTNKPLT